MVKTIRRKLIILSSAITSLCSAASLHLKLLLPLLPDAYTASAPLPKIAATVITRLVTTRPNLKAHKNEVTAEADVVEIQEARAIGS